MNEIENGRNNLKEQKSEWYNIETRYKAGSSVINLFVDYSAKARYGEGIKTLTHKQMLQRLPIVLAEVKTSNTPENLLNDIGQKTASLYLGKQITEDIQQYNELTQQYNNII